MAKRSPMIAIFASLVDKPSIFELLYGTCIPDKGFGKYQTPGDLTVFFSITMQSDTLDASVNCVNKLPPLLSTTSDRSAETEADDQDTLLQPFFLTSISNVLYQKRSVPEPHSAVHPLRTFTKVFLPLVNTISRTPFSSENIIEPIQDTLPETNIAPENRRSQ